jgi:hypothetical protein
MIRKIIVLSLIALSSCFATDKTQDLKDFANNKILYELKDTTQKVILDIEFSANQKDVHFRIQTKYFEDQGEYKRYIQDQDAQKETTNSRWGETTTEDQSLQVALSILRIVQDKVSDKPRYASMVSSLITRLEVPKVTEGN